MNMLRLRRLAIEGFSQFVTCPLRLLSAGVLPGESYTRLKTPPSRRT